MYLLRVKNNSLSSISDIEPGLDKRIISCSNTSNSTLELIKCIKTKRYTFTRIQRILIHLLLDLTKETFLKITKNGPQYIRVLGANENGLNILSQIKRKSQVPIITKFSSYTKYNNENINDMISLDKIATDIYFLGFNKKTPISNMDYTTSPYIKRE